MDYRSAPPPDIAPNRGQTAEARARTLLRQLTAYPGRTVRLDRGTAELRAPLQPELCRPGERPGLVLGRYGADALDVLVRAGRVCPCQGGTYEPTPGARPLPVDYEPEPEMDAVTAAVVADEMEPDEDPDDEPAEVAGDTPLPPPSAEAAAAQTPNPMATATADRTVNGPITVRLPPIDGLITRNALAAAAGVSPALLSLHEKRGQLPPPAVKGAPNQRTQYRVDADVVRWLEARGFTVEHEASGPPDGPPEAPELHPEEVGHTGPAGVARGRRLRELDEAHPAGAPADPSGDGAAAPEEEHVAAVSGSVTLPPAPGPATSAEAFLDEEPPAVAREPLPSGPIPAEAFGEGEPVGHFGREMAGFIIEQPLPAPPADGAVVLGRAADADATPDEPGDRTLLRGNAPLFRPLAPPRSGWARFDLGQALRRVQALAIDLVGLQTDPEPEAEDLARVGRELEEAIGTVRAALAAAAVPLHRAEQLLDAYRLPEARSVACEGIGNMVPPLLMQRVYEANPL